MQLWMQYALVGVGLEASHIAQYIFFRSSIKNALMTSFSSHAIGVLLFSFVNRWKVSSIRVKRTWRLKQCIGHYS